MDNQELMDNQENGIWELMDQESYNLLTKNGIGQICNDYFSECIEKYASDCSFKNYLEIGTWNGLGSTKAFNNGFIKRIDDYKFYSLECNKDKCMKNQMIFMKYFHKLKKKNYFLNGMK